MQPFLSLDEILHAILNGDERALMRASPTSAPLLRLDLPTFGGPTPSDGDDEVWSWDAQRVLVGMPPHGLQILPREVWEADAPERRRRRAMQEARFDAWLQEQERTRLEKIPPHLRQAQPLTDYDLGLTIQRTRAGPRAHFAALFKSLPSGALATIYNANGISGLLEEEAVLLLQNEYPGARILVSRGPWYDPPYVRYDAQGQREDEAPPIGPGPDIPSSVLANRGELTTTEAIAYWLCQDPAGPRLSPNDAQRALGMEHRQQLDITLRRATAKMTARSQRTVP